MYLSAAGALIQDARQAIIANNIANASTTGYKSDEASFGQRLTEARARGEAARGAGAVQEDLTGGLALSGVEFSRTQGTLNPTGNPLDLALRGDGFFAVTDGRQVLYTRAGNFALNTKGELVTADGRYKVLGADGKPIRVGPGDVKVAADGTVQVGGRPSGRLLVAGSLDPALFRKVGGTNFRYVGSGQPAAAKAEVVQGFLEASDVSPVSEMARLIGCQRAYEANMQMARIQDITLGRGVSEAGRVIA